MDRVKRLISHEIVKLLAGLGLLIMLSACRGDLSPGQQMKFKDEVPIFFPVGQDQYHPLSDEEITILKKDARWVIPDCLTLSDESITVQAGDVSWQDGDTTYTGKGALLTFAGTVHVGKDCPGGSYSIKANFPGLAELIQRTNILPKMVVVYGTPALFVLNPIPIRDIRIHATAVGAFFSSTVRTIATIAGILILLAIGAAVGSEIRK